MKGLISFRGRKHRFWFLLIVLVFSLAGTVQMQAQVVGGTILGTITDKSGAIVPQASILVRNQANGVTRTVKTDPVGFYTAPNLLPGTYEVTISAAGFAASVKSDVTLTVGNQLVLNFTLNVGQVSEVVHVSTEAPTIDLASSAIGAVVDSTTIRELPLNGRSWTDLAILQPGVLAVETQSPFNAGSNRGNRGFENEVAINGARPQQNNYRLDGISIEDFANGGSGSVLGGNVGVDAIEEFSVLSSNLSAEYGRTSGGVINAVTRSGTNQFHGSVYEFLRNSALDAANFFDNAGGIQKPSFKRNQFGASAGGPIRKDKIFIFGDYEGIRQSRGIASPVTVPSDNARLGLLTYPGATADPTKFPSDCAPTGSADQCQVTVGPSVQKYLPFWPHAASTSPGANIGSFTFAGQQVVNEDFFTVRADDKISDKDSLSATYLRDITPYQSPDGLDAVLISSATRRQIVTLEETHVFSAQLVNAFRLGFSRAVTDNDGGLTAINPLAKDPSLAALPGQFASAVTVPGLTVFTGGVNGTSHYGYFWNSYQAYDDAFYTRGTHALKFGVAFERAQLNQTVLADQSGGFFFGSLHDFLTNQPSRFEAGLPSSVNERGLRQSILGLYAQDDWHWRSNFTLNLGLRWEMATVPTEVHNALASLQNVTDSQQRIGSPLFSNPTLRNFEPRVGFAWDPFRDAKTAVRGSFGIFDALPLPYQFSLMISKQAPFYQHARVRHLPQDSFYAGALPPNPPLSALVGNYIEPHPHRNYVMQWNLNVERELTNNLSAMVAYVGSRGVHQGFRVDDLDMVLPTKTPQGYLFPAQDPTNTLPTFNPNFGQIYGLAYAGNSFYHALLAGVTKRMSHGLEFQGSFTWGKSIDNSSGSIAGDTFSNGLSSLPWYDINSNRGLSDFDIRRTVMFSATWQVPEPKSWSGPARWVTSGWELGTIFKANDGAPFTATWGTSGDPQLMGSGDPWAFPDRLTGPGCQSLVNPGNPNNYIKTECFTVPSAPNQAFWAANCNSTPYTDAAGNPVSVLYPLCFNLRGNAGRNILIGPGLTNLDFSIFKNNRIRKISENFNVQFRAEFFNVLNHANFSVPVTPDNTDIFDATGAPTGVAGKLTSTTTTAREIQFAMKLFW
jgi:hypothetical protein